MKKMISLTLFSVIVGLFSPIASEAATTAKVGAHCTRVGLSTISQGQVLTCSSGSVWRVKGNVKIGTNTYIQSVLNDTCETLKTTAIFNDISYTCTKTPSGNRWEIAPTIRTTTTMIRQEITEKSCATIGLVTMLNGMSFTCTYQQGVAIWQETNLVQANTRIKYKTFAGTKCDHIGDITNYKNAYYYCAGSGTKSGKWATYNAAAYPTVIQTAVVAQAKSDIAAATNPAPRPTQTTYKRVPITGPAPTPTP
jgi:hypothetical protein